MHIDDIIAYENGDLSDAEALRMFAAGIKSGMVWQLQGLYGRTANALIYTGYLDEEGNILKEVDDESGYD